MAESTPAAIRREWVESVNSLVRRGGLQTAMRLGHFVLDTWFDGDPVRFEVSRRSDTGYRQLLRDPALRVSEGQLTVAVRVTVLVAELPAAVAEALTMTQHRDLLAVRGSRERMGLARQAVDHGWSRARLRARIDRAVAGQARRRGPGRPRLTGLQRTLNAVHRGVEQLERQSVTVGVGISSGDRLRWRRALDTLEWDLARLETFRRALAKELEQ